MCGEKAFENFDTKGVKVNSEVLVILELACEVLELH
jgi:hypothetical protein